MPAAHQNAGAVVDEPVIQHRAHRLAEPHSKMLATEVDARIGEHVTVGWCNRPGRNRCVSGPGTVSVLFAFPSNAALRMPRNGVILLKARRTVVIVVIGVGDVCRAAVLNLDFKPMADVPGVIDRIEVVDTAVGDAGLGIGR